MYKRQALVHGDPCPDNVLFAADGRAVLIDFEFARPSHALFDAAYWRMGFPTCWCAGTIPTEVEHRIDLSLIHISWRLHPVSTCAKARPWS